MRFVAIKTRLENAMLRVTFSTGQGGMLAGVGVHFITLLTVTGQADRIDFFAAAADVHLQGIMGMVTAGAAFSAGS